MNIKKQSNEEDDDNIYPHKATGFPPNEAAKPENWFEVHDNMEIQAKHNRQYPHVKVGDKVKVYRSRGALSKEVEGDYKYDATVVTGIERSLGQTLYKVQGARKPFLRSDILLIKESEEGAEAAEPADPPPEEEPYMSYKRKRIIAREKNKELRETRAKEVAAAKEAEKKAKADAKAAVVAGKAGLKAERAGARTR